MMRLFEWLKKKPNVNTLYVSRCLDKESAGNLIAWAQYNGFDKTVKPRDIHVTIVFSKKTIDWNIVPRVKGDYLAPADKRLPRALKRFDQGVVVLTFTAPALEKRFQQIRDLGASFDYDTYQPHVTITYKGDPKMDLTKIEPFNGPLQFGPEVFREVVLDWGNKITEK